MLKYKKSKQLAILVLFALLFTLVLPGNIFLESARGEQSEARLNVSDIKNKNDVLIVGDYLFDLYDESYTSNNYLTAAKTVYTNLETGNNEVYYYFNGAWYDLIAVEDLGFVQAAQVSVDKINGDGTYKYLATDLFADSKALAEYVNGLKEEDKSITENFVFKNGDKVVVLPSSLEIDKISGTGSMVELTELLGTDNNGIRISKIGDVAVRYDNAGKVTEVASLQRDIKAYLQSLMKTVASKEGEEDATIADILRKSIEVPIVLEKGNAKRKVLFTIEFDRPTDGYVATTPEELTAMIAVVEEERIEKYNTIYIDGELGSTEDYTVYTINKPVTIKGVGTGENKAKVYGTFNIKANDVTIDGLTIYTHGYKADKVGYRNEFKSAINVIAKSVTIKNNHFELADSSILTGPYDIGNGIVIWPYGDGEPDYSISNNSFKNYSTVSQSYGSTAIQITEGVSLSRFGKDGNSVSVNLDYEAEKAIATGNTYENNDINYTHGSWLTGSYKVIFSSASNGKQFGDIAYAQDGTVILLIDNFEFISMKNGKNSTVNANITIKGNHTVTIAEGSSLTINAQKTLTIDKGATISGSIINYGGTITGQGTWTEPKTGKIATPENIVNIFTTAPEGSIIQMTAGVHDLSTLVNVNPNNNLTLLGGEGVTVKGIRLGGANQYAATMPDNFTLKNIAFTGSFDIHNNDVNNLTIDSCTFSNQAVLKINSVGTLDGLTIKNSTFNATGQDDKTSILVQAPASNVLIENNTITGSAHNGIQITRVNGSLTINSNTISNTGSRSMRIATLEGADITITDNIMSTANTNETEAAKNNGEIIKISGIVTDGTFTGNTYGGEEITFTDGIATAQ